MPMSKEYRDQYIASRKKDGLCVSCNEKAVSETYCQKHLELSRLRVSRFRENRKMANKCIHCGISLEDGRSACCSNCKDKHNEYKRSSINCKYRALKNNAKTRNIDVSLSCDEFKSWYESNEKQCSYCGVTEIQLKMTKKKKSVLTIDRKNNEIGYEICNMCFACHRCNNMKSNFFTEDEWRDISQRYIRPRLEKYHGLE